MRLLPKKQLQIRGRVVGGERVLFCLPLQEKSTDKLYLQAQSLKTFVPDMVEWRLDGFTGLADMDLCLHTLELLRSVLDDIPLLLTCRLVDEGGEGDISQQQRRLLLDGLIGSHKIDLVDVELSSGGDVLDHVSGIARENGVKTIFSYHNFTTTPPQQELLAILQKMEESGADIAKLAVMPLYQQDVLTLFQATLMARTSLLDIPLIAIAMGDMGKISRLAAGLFGSDITFAYAAGASAPGQLHIAGMRQMMPFFY
ncbi:MAG: type I 3-dehydroquinate dehydratase [Desulfobacterales bacterium]|nr:MAG: type I 3-dehydroquinate dehydratase [Desulfobacterales bacterium]